MTRLVLFVLSLFSPGGADDALVRRLAAEDWSERDRAGAALTRRGWAARAALRRGLAHDDPEVRHRCEALYAQALSDVIEGFGELPECDALYFDSERTVDGTRAYHRELFWGVPWMVSEPYLQRVGKDSWPWANYRLATRLWLTDWLQAGVPPWVLRPVVAEMHRRDEIFLNGTSEPQRMEPANE